MLLIAANATSSIAALFVVGLGLAGAGFFMLRAFVRSRRAYASARRTRRRITGIVIGHRSENDEGATLVSPVVEYVDPKSGRKTTYTPDLTTSLGRLKEGREVPLLLDDRGREPILDVRPFGAGFTGGAPFLILATLCVGLGLLAMYVVFA